MNYQIKLSSSARKALKKLGRSGKFNPSILNKILYCFERGESLPVHVKDHALRGNFIGSRECHLGFNLLLIYKYNDELKVITVSDIGTHPELFGE